MTIRQRTRWICFWLTPITFIILLGYGGLLALTAREVIQEGLEWARIALALPVPILMVGMLGWADHFIRCPRCGGRLGKTAAKSLRFEFDPNRADRCPHCRVHFDFPARKPMARA